MKRNLSAMKNLGWALAILLCLLVLFVALIVAAVLPGPAELERGGVQLNELDSRPAEQPSQTEEPETLGELRTVPESTDAGQGYIDGLTFLVDSSAIGLRDYALLTGGTATTQVWGSTAGNIPAGNLADFRIRYQAEGTEISPIEAAAKAQPARLVIILGTDGLDNVDESSFVEGYVSLIKGIQQASPNTVILVCSVSSVATSYSGVDGVNANTIKTVNGWIRTVCMRTGVYFCDTASAVNDRAGWLDVDYAAANGKSLNTAGLQRILEYLRTHAV
ncbi:MAG: SGNH/GDSL hydrolase family protein [Oscillospiraceae bacterium]|nr:SGNH/GDSL hydrolase family protein [Oscillospiraceae bacterium]